MVRSYILIALIFANCATYLRDRKNDLKDTVNLGVESPGYGIGLRMSIIPFGFLFQGGESSLGKKDLGSGLGIKGGHIGEYSSQQLTFVVMGGEDFHAIKEGKELQTPRALSKKIHIRTFSIINDPVKDRKARKKELVREEILSRSKLDPRVVEYYKTQKTIKSNGYPKSYPYQIEFMIALHYGLRIGINVAEILDFVMGWTTFDWMDDDLEDTEEASGMTGLPLPIESD
jgi:hypothetical protein